MYSSKINPAELLGLTTEKKIKYFEQYLEKSNRSSDAKEVLEYILKSETEPHQYQLILTILQKLADKSPGDLRYALGQLDYYLQYCKTFETFIVLVRYMLTYESSVSNSKLESSFNHFAKKFNFYEKEIIQMEGKNYQNYIRIIAAVRMGMQMLPKLYIKLGKNMDMSYLSVLMQWILICPAANVQDCKVIQRYSRFLAQQCVNHKVAGDAFDCTETRNLLKLIIEKSQFNYEGAQNLCFIIESLNDMVISSAISSNIQLFTQFTPESYLKCFHTLIGASMGPRTLRFFICISNALKQEFQFHILKKIYEEFIINTLARYYKFTSTAQVQLQDLVSLYVYGFMNKISVQPQSVKYFLTDYRLLTKKQMIFWLQMAVIIGYQQPKIQRVIMPLINQITPMKNLNQIVSEIVYQNQKKHSWRFLQKDLKEKKRYKLSSSKKSGIINQNVNCYIITVMQAFFMSKILPTIVKDYESLYCNRGYIRDEIKLPLLYQLNRLFDTLKLQIKNISIDAIKKVGPEDFRDPIQQDCQHYFNEFFESIGKQIDLINDSRAKRQFQQKFKDAFQIVIKNQRLCSKCDNKSQNQVECYIHSIDYKEILAQQWETTLQDYVCGKCNHKGNQKQKSRIVKFPQIMILHIKRFHFDRDLGEVKKLQQASIVRKFKNYELQGFISHIGSQVRCGHYILYYKKPNDPLTWMLFDDKRVQEFKIDSEDQIFQTNFKSQNTPYIVIYQKTNSRK